MGINLGVKKISELHGRKKKMAKILPLAGDPRGLGHSQGRGAPAELPTLPPLSPRVQPTVSLSPFPGFVFSLA